MKPIIKDYVEEEISPFSTLRTILLFGRNVSTYKFALADTLLQSPANSSLSYKDLRDSFLKSLYKHYIINPNQYQAGSNSITRAFDQFSLDNDWDKVVPIAEKNIYNNVFDAFHNVGGSSIKKEHILFEHDQDNRQIILTDKLHQIIETSDIAIQLTKENQSRWAVVEEAWKNKLSPNLLVYDNDKNIYSVVQGQKRVNLRSAVDVLIPYQHGRCFYCNKKLNVNAKSSENDFPDVDHVIPFSAFNNQIFTDKINSNVIWNLVIACQECNRGNNGKFNTPPDKYYFEKLINRNILFTQEHKHSLKNTILMSLGASNHQQVRQKMSIFQSYINLINGWKPRIIHVS